jgi:hypothetical protein
LGLRVGEGRAGVGAPGAIGGVSEGGVEMAAAGGMSEML